MSIYDWVLPTETYIRMHLNSRIFSTIGYGAVAKCEIEKKNEIVRSSITHVYTGHDDSRTVLQRVSPRGLRWINFFYVWTKNVTENTWKSNGIQRYGLPMLTINNLLTLILTVDARAYSNISGNTITVIVLHQLLYRKNVFTLRF